MLSRLERALRLAAVAAVVAVAGSAASAAPVATGGAAQAFRLGALRLVALRDADNVLPNDGKVIGVDVGPASVAQVLAHAQPPTDKIVLSVDALLVQEPGGRVILLDTGLGPAVHGALMQSLAQAGVPPARVTDVLITHSHPDHVGGLLAADGTLALPNATIRMSADEWGWMQGRPQAAALVRAIAPRVQTFAPGGEVAPGIVSVPLPGHTPGHTGYEIRSEGQRLLDMGDTAHSSIVSLAKPEWTIAYDNDAAAGKRTRRATLTRLAADQEWVFAPHFPFPGVGHVVVRGDGFAWAPGLP